MSPTMSSYPWHPQQTRGRYAFAFAAVALALGVWLAALREPELWPRILTAIFALVAVGLLIEQDTRIDTDAHTVVREGRLFGRFRVWIWRHPLSEFTGVAMRRHSDPEGSDTVFVGLRRRGGRLMAVRYFYAGVGQPSVEAERVARSLADTTGLPLHDDVA